MPIHLQGGMNQTEDTLSNFVNLDFDDLYRDQYDGSDLKPFSSEHNRLRDMILNRAHDSARVMMRKHPIWQRIDWTLTSYVPLDKKEIESLSRDSRKPVSIVFPISFENKETLLTYLVIAFLDNPILKYEGAGAGADREAKAILMERTVSLQMRRGKAGIALHTAYSDALSYGFGAIHVMYGRKTATRTNTVDVLEKSELPGIGDVISRTEGETEEVTIFEGNQLEALDVYKVLPDPDVPIHEVRKMEMFGWIQRTSLSSLLGEEKSNDHIFNALYLRGLGNDLTSKIYPSTTDGRSDRYGGKAEKEGTLNKTVDVLWMYIKIIPKEWKLGESDYPELWLFGIAGDRVLISAQKMELDHGMIPVAVMAPHSDGHAVSPVSSMEVIYGLQGVADFFFNTRALNVKKSLNDMFIIDPEAVNIKSLVNKGAGRMIYLKKSMWGENKIDSVIRQFPVADVTQNLPTDVNFARDSARSGIGAVDALMGVRRRGGERVSATEAQATQQSALSRMERMARLIDLQAMVDIAQMCASNTRQFMTIDTWVNMTGRLEEVLRKEYNIEGDLIKVDPSTFNDAWQDYIPNDGSIPGNGNTQIWQQIFQTVSTNESIQGEFDIVRIFQHLARISGARNIEAFMAKRGGTLPELQKIVRPDEDIVRGVDNGDLSQVPLGLEDELV